MAEEQGIEDANTPREKRSNSSDLGAIPTDIGVSEEAGDTGESESYNIANDVAEIELSERPKAADLTDASTSNEIDMSDSGKSKRSQAITKMQSQFDELRSHVEELVGEHRIDTGPTRSAESHFLSWYVRLCRFKK